MILAPPAALDALRALRRRARSACLAAIPAARVHLRRPLAVPIAVDVREPEGIPSHPLLVLARAAGTSRVVVVQGIAVPRLEVTLAALLGLGGEALDLIAALLQEGSSLEDRALDRRAWSRACEARGAPAEAARLRWWLFRLGETYRPEPGDAEVSLDPGGSPEGPRAPGGGLVINIADGMPDPQGAAAAMLARAFAERAAVAEIAALFAAGLALSPTILAARHARALHHLRRLGMLVGEASLRRPRPPFDGACAALGARVAGSTLRSLLRALVRATAGRDDPDLVLVHLSALAALGEIAALRRALPAARGLLARASAEAIARLLARVPAAAHIDLVAAAPGLFERVGRWEELARHAADLAAKRRGLQQAAAFVRAAAAAWRLDRGDEAERWLRRAAAARRLRPEDRLEATLLHATLDAERGALDAAERRLREALGPAMRRGDGLAEAKILHRLGSVDARRGRLAEALATYDAALQRCPPEALALRGVLRSNTAAILLWTGRLDEAELRARAALRDRVTAGTAAEQLATRVLLARIEAGLGVAMPPGGRMLPLAWQAEREGGARLTTEVWTDAARELAQQGRHDAARDALDGARRALVRLGGTEPALPALVAACEGELARLRGDLGAALTALQRAVRGLDALGLGYYASVARRSWASAALAAGEARAAARILSRVAAACERAGLWLGDDALHVPLLCEGSLAPAARLRRYAERCLSGLDDATVWRALATHADGSLARRYAARHDANAAAKVTSAGVTRTEDRAALARLEGLHAVRVDLRAGTLHVPGRGAVALTRRRVLVPLLVALARAPEGIPVRSLCAQVWQRRPSPSARTAVKVAISRLRGLLDVHAAALVPSGHGAEAGYRWDTKVLPLLIVTEGPLAP